MQMLDVVVVMLVPVSFLKLVWSEPVLHCVCTRCDVGTCVVGTCVAPDGCDCLCISEASLLEPVLVVMLVHVSICGFSVVVVMLVPVSFLKLVLSEPVLHQMVVMLVPVSIPEACVVGICVAPTCVAPDGCDVGTFVIPEACVVGICVALQMLESLVSELQFVVVMMVPVSFQRLV